jgi:tetratricopeptide (TPR) repeat protein
VEAERHDLLWEDERESYPGDESREEEGPSLETESVVAGKAFEVGEASLNVTDEKVPPKKKAEKQSEKQLAVSREKAEAIAGKEEAFLNKIQTSPKKVDKNQLDTATQGRNVLARTGDDIEISLVNEGWLFLGYRDMKSADGIIFKSRQYGEGKTLFTFRAQRLGSYDLPFMYQDARSGDQKKILISVSVLKDDEFEKKLSEEVIEDQEPYDLQYAERLIKLGNHKAALDEFLKARQNNQEGSAYLNQRIAHLYYQMQKFPEAYSYWRQNTRAPEPFSDLATVGIVSSSIEMGDHPGLLKNLTDFLNITALPIGRETLDLAGFLMSCGDRESARDALLEYSRIHPDGEVLDQVFYLLGQVYEEDREFKLAREAYTKVFTDYPGSALTVKAKERVQFLKRHFLYIQ